MKLFLLGLFALAMSSPALAFNVYDHDNRVAMVSDDYPWSAVGRLKSSPNADGMINICTATLVDKDVILTAAHCFFENGKVREGDFVFEPGFKSGKGTIAAHVVSLVYDSRYPVLPRGEAVSHDWALAKLDSDFGSRRGYIPVYGADPFAMASLASTEKSVTLAGYSHDYLNGNTAGIASKCSVRRAEMGSLMYHDCDMTSGASGGALLVQTRDNKWLVVGVNVAEAADATGMEFNGEPYSDDKANVAVSASEFFGQWQKLVKGTLPGPVNENKPVIWLKLNEMYSMAAWATNACSLSPSRVFTECRKTAQDFVTKYPMPTGGDELVAYRAGLLLSVCQVPNSSNSGSLGPLWQIERRICFSRATAGSSNVFASVHSLCLRGTYNCYVQELERISQKMR